MMGRENPKITLFSPGAFDTLLQAVVQRVTVRYPPVIANNPERTVSQERVEEILEDSFAGALEHRESRMGFLGRMRLKSALKWELREIGYEEKFADFAVEKFVEQLARKSV